MSLFTAKQPKKFMGDSFCEIIDGPHYVYKVLEQTETNGIFGSEIVERLYLEYLARTKYEKKLWKTYT